MWFSKSNETVAIARAIKRQARQAQQTPGAIREDLTLADIEALEASLVNEIMSSLSAQLGIEDVSG